MSSLNVTNVIVHPDFFIIEDISEIPYSSLYCTFLFFCYGASFIGNIFVMTIIIVIHNLHTPKYMAVFNLALADLGESTAFIPNIIETFIFSMDKIYFEACLVNMFFVLFFFCMQSLALALLAFDRFVAICFPLRYHSIVTNTSMGALVAMLWLFDVTFATLMVSLITRVSFCHSTIINSFSCAYGHIYELSCADLLLNSIFATITMTLLYFIPMVLIGFSYVSILFPLFKITSWAERLKALKTCVSHIMLVCVYYVPLVSIDVAVNTAPFHKNSRVINVALSSILPPVLNPIVYSLSTAEIREFIKRMFNRNRTKSIIPAVCK